MTLLFFLLTLAVTWTASASLAGEGNAGFFGVHGPLFVFGVFAPGFVALALTARTGGRSSVRRLVARIGHWPRSDRSLLLVMLMHAAINNTMGIVPAAVPGASDSWSFSGSLVGWITVALSWAIAVPLRYQMRGVSLEADDAITEPRRAIT